ncbi:MAG TPA: TrkH family potassium uptake protein [Candidatus Coprenecus stercoravium]|uniref:TrkH family potassium uptake protein n=1 Tax=Candidatus Coprenecus stercoravium TaxID=2840735 RepID=A0A9D2KAG7_9BACT|nr:TrkH family potassium uptake protein [Candidatus Coprenecus stercoravium]
MNIKLVARYIGIALLFNAMFMFISLAVSALNGFDSSFSPLLLSALITAMVGCFPLIFVRGEDDINLREGFAITVFSWILCCIFGMLPYVMWGGEFTLSNAWFESVSGYTTTGGTILTDVEVLPKGLLFWRSSTHFIGGMGVMVFMLLVLPSMSMFRMRISRIEISSLSKDNYRYRSKETVKVIATTYVGITVVTLIALMLAGMSFFDAVNHAMSIVSTGGFSTRNLSIMYYDSLPIEIVCIVAMYISTLHFGMVYAFFVKRSAALLKSPVFRYFMGFCIVMSLLIGLDLKVSGQAATYGEAMRLSFFQFSSIVSSTGFATADTSVWPLFSIFLLLFAMYHGGCSGSTCGGIKADRMWIFYKVLKNNIFKQLHPNAVIPVKVGDNTIDPSVTKAAVLYIGAFTIILVIGSMLIGITEPDFEEAFAASMTSLGNVGPGLGASGSMGNFSHFSPFAKLIMSIEMLLGRLEIYTLLMLFFIFKKV